MCIEGVREDDLIFRSDFLYIRMMHCVHFILVTLKNDEIANDDLFRFYTENIAYLSFNFFVHDREKKNSCTTQYQTVHYIRDVSDDLEYHCRE